MEYIEEGSPREGEVDDVEWSPTSPHLEHLSKGEAGVVHQINEIFVEKLIKSLHEIDLIIQKKVDALETLDITVQIVSFKIFEATYDFKIKIEELKEERARLLTSIDNKSELSLILHDLDRKISDLESELDGKIQRFNHEKIDLQQQAEAIILQLDDDISVMRDRLQVLDNEIGVKVNTLYEAQVMIINQKYAKTLEEFQKHLLAFEKLHLTGWRVEHSDVKLSEILEEQGLKFTVSGKLLTRTGSLMTFEEAQDKGYFKEISINLEKILKFFEERDQQSHILDHIGVSPDSAAGYSEGSSTADSKMSSEDLKYLKQYVGKPLTLALAEITAKQPRDPIHYLGHYLFKYRYNQELEEIQKSEIEELTLERKMLAQERWKKFVEGEARNAVIEMVLRAENIAYQNELRRIEREQMLAQEEEEGQEEESEEMKKLLEEARDKFE